MLICEEIFFSCLHRIFSPYYVTIVLGRRFFSGFPEGRCLETLSRFVSCFLTDTLAVDSALDRAAADSAFDRAVFFPQSEQSTSFCLDALNSRRREAGISSVL